MNIADKISKIIAKADSTTSDEEAEAFLQMAHKLMREHGITLLDLGRLDQDDPVGHDKGVYVSSDRWKDEIAFALAKFYGAEMIRSYYSRASNQYTVFGRLSARTTFIVMLPYVLKRIAAMALIEHKAGMYQSAQKARTALAHAMARRLWAMFRENKIKYQSVSGVNPLVPVDIIALEVESVFPEVKIRKAKLKTDTYAVEKVKEINLNLQAPAPANAKRIAQ